jgi:hypothetical protein
MSKRYKDKPQTSADQLSENDLNFLRTFQSDAGKRVLEELKRVLRYGENVYHSGQANEDLHYQLGRQSVINDILFIIKKQERK